VKDRLAIHILEKVNYSKGWMDLEEIFRSYWKKTGVPLSRGVFPKAQDREIGGIDLPGKIPKTVSMNS